MLGISMGTETIVLLENEAGTRRLISEMLILAGYEVREAADSTQAVRLIEDGVHLADMLLAGMDTVGGEMPQLLRQQFPNLRVLLTSTQADESAIQTVAASGAQVLPKPFSPGALMSKVRQVLDQPVSQPAARGASAG